MAEINTETRPCLTKKSPAQGPSSRQAFGQIPGRRRARVGWCSLVGSKRHQSVSRDREGSSFFPVVSKLVGELKDPPEILSPLAKVPESGWQGVPH